MSLNITPTSNIPDLPERIFRFWYYDTSRREVHEYDYPGGYKVHRNCLQWCPSPIPQSKRPQGEKIWCLMLHDHSQRSGYFFAHHKDKAGRILRFTLYGAIKKARELNGQKEFGCDMLGPLNLPVEGLLPGQLGDLEALKDLEKDQLVNIITNLVHDWQKLNQIHNKRAEEHGWCGAYENRQFNYNAHFRTMQLVGRGDLRGGIMPGL